MKGVFPVMTLAVPVKTPFLNLGIVSRIFPYVFNQMLVNLSLPSNYQTYKCASPSMRKELSTIMDGVGVV